jgi:hypothetical protein
MKMFEHSIDSKASVIRLQGYEREYGYTDIEIDVPSVGCCIIEAKRGWNLPHLAMEALVEVRAQGTPQGAVLQTESPCFSCN